MGKEETGWEWIASVDTADDIREQHVLAAYHLDWPACAPTENCRKNCKNNLKCRNYLGEKGWLSGAREKDAIRLYEQSTLDLKRKPDECVGLVNVGATCYVNSLLQMWFHNPCFRNAVLEWTANSPAPADSEEKAMYQLQRVFAFMLLSDKKSFNPVEFINTMGLSHFEQQDAQEFWKLFMNIVERQLEQRGGAGGRAFLQKEFGGKYVYRTTCQRCGHASTRPSNFNELEIGLSEKELKANIDKYFAPEILDGDNQYFCDKCQAKSDATRQIVLRNLPNVLTFHLMRFIFNMKTMSKKKLSSSLRFPETLDMSEYVEGAKRGSRVYHLQAVLLHRGPSAYSGHYVCQTQDLKSKKWYLCDDDVCQEIKANAKGRVPLGNDADDARKAASHDKKASKAQDAAEAVHDSSSAYMLMYRKEASVQELDALDVACAVPDALRQIVAADNTAFHSDIQESIQQHAKKADEIKQKTESVLKLWRSLTTESDNSRLEFVPTAWIASWLKQKLDPSERATDEVIAEGDLLVSETKGKGARDAGLSSSAMVVESGDAASSGSRAPSDAALSDRVPSDLSVVVTSASLATQQPSGDSVVLVAEDDEGVVGKMDLLPLTCPHGKMSPHRVSAAKLVSAAGVDEVQERFGVLSSRLPLATSLCRECVEVQYRLERETDALNNDRKEVAQRLREFAKDPAPHLETSFWVHKDVFRQWDRLKPGEARSGIFNELCSCEHGNFLADENKRRRVPESVWRTLCKYFKSHQEYSAFADSCRACLRQKSENDADTEVKKSIAATEKQELPRVVKKGNLVSAALLLQGEREIFVVPSFFLNSWRSWVRQPASNVRPEEIDFGGMVCADHQRFCFDVRCDLNERGTGPKGPAADSLQTDFEFVTADEWATLTSYGYVKRMGDPGLSAPLCREIRVFSDGDKNLLSEPDVCEPCRLTRVAVERTQALEYSSGFVFVTRVDTFKDGDDGDDPAGDPTLAPEDLVDGEDEEPSSQKRQSSENGDGEFAVGGSRKKGGKAGGKTEGGSAKSASQGEDGDSRRRGRSRLGKNARRLRVSSSMTIRELKLELLRIFGAMPVDQHLFFAGRELGDMDRSLGSYEVPPGATLDFFADQPTGDFAEVEMSKTKEQGFKGTALLSSSAPFLVHHLEDDAECLFVQSDATATAATSSPCVTVDSHLADSHVSCAVPPDVLLEEPENGTSGPRRQTKKKEPKGRKSAKRGAEADNAEVKMSVVAGAAPLKHEVKSVKLARASNLVAVSSASDGEAIVTPPKDATRRTASGKDKATAKDKDKGSSGQMKLSADHPASPALSVVVDAEPVVGNASDLKSRRGKRKQSSKADSAPEGEDSDWGASNGDREAPKANGRRSAVAGAKSSAKADVGLRAKEAPTVTAVVTVPSVPVAVVAAGPPARKRTRQTRVGGSGDEDTLGSEGDVTSNASDAGNAGDAGDAPMSPVIARARMPQARPVAIPLAARRATSPRSFAAPSPKTSPESDGSRPRHMDAKGDSGARTTPKKRLGAGRPPKLSA